MLAAQLMDRVEQLERENEDLHNQLKRQEHNPLSPTTQIKIITKALQGDEHDEAKIDKATRREKNKSIQLAVSSAALFTDAKKLREVLSCPVVLRVDVGCVSWSPSRAS